MLRSLFSFLISSLAILTNGQSDPFEISIRGGTDSNEGYIVTSYYGESGRICEKMWDDVDASVACRQLGLGNSGVAYVGSQNVDFEGWRGTIRFSDFNCKGDENDLNDCDHKLVRVEEHSCPGRYVAGLRCTKDYDLRLSETDTAGRVEIYLNGEWTTVCDEGWDDSDAIVVCRQFTGRYDQERAVAIPGGKIFGEGSGVVGFVNFKCNGSERLLSECESTSMPDSAQCSHRRDAGVDCNGTPCSSQPCQNNGKCQVTSSGNRVCTCQDGYTGALCEAEAQNRLDPGSTTSTHNLGIVIIITVSSCLAMFFLFLLISYMIMKAVNRDVDKNVVVVIPTAPSMEDIGIENEYNDEYDEEKNTENESYHSDVEDENKWKEEQFND